MHLARVHMLKKFLQVPGNSLSNLLKKKNFGSLGRQHHQHHQHRQHHHHNYFQNSKYAHKFTAVFSIATAQNFLPILLK
jgi:hypothetical protein